MKRYGKNDHLIEAITEESNLNESIDRVLRGRRRKRTKAGRYILSHRKEIIERLQREIRSGTFKVTHYKEMMVTDGPKVRRVQSVSLYERIGCNAIMRVVEAVIKKHYIMTTASSIEGRGMHYLKRCIEADIKKDPDGTRYNYKFDIHKFYESVSQDFMMYSLRRMFKEPTLLTILERFVRMMPSGLSIGLRSSQGFANLLISMFLDHYLKDRMGVKYFYRYCDDGMAFGDKARLWIICDTVHERVELMQLKVKANDRVRPTADGIDFLGYINYPEHSLLRKRNKQKAVRALHRLKSKKRIAQWEATLYGECKHCNGRNLFKKLTGKTMEQYKRLKDQHIKASYEDGKKRFEGREVNLETLQGEEFLVLDFETGIVTSPQRKDYERKVETAQRRLDDMTRDGRTPPKSFVYPDDIEKPVGKYLMHIRRNDGVEVKVFTGDHENYSILEQMRQIGLPMLASVEPIRCKGFTRYRLC